MGRVLYGMYPKRAVQQSLVSPASFAVGQATTMEEETNLAVGKLTAFWEDERRLLYQTACHP